jgi:hypothetical protein
MQSRGAKAPAKIDSSAMWDIPLSIIFRFPIGGISISLDAIAALRLELAALAGQRQGEVLIAAQ